MRGVFDEMTAVRWACGTEDGSHQRPLYGAATASNVAHGLFHSSGGMITPGGGDPGGDHGKPNTRRTSGVHAKGGVRMSCAEIRCRPFFDRRNSNRAPARIFDLLCEC